MSRTRWGDAGAATVVVALLTGLFLLPAAPAAPAAFAAPEPSIELSATSVRRGQVILVTLREWPTGSVTVAICGNDARRGSPDCDQVGSAAAGPFTNTDHEEVEMTVRFPPPPCPCVVRAVATANSLIRTVPLKIDGAPVATVVGPEELPSPLRATARVLPTKVGLVSRLKSWLGGQTDRLLELTVTNSGSVSLGPIAMSAAVGRSRGEGTPLDLPAVTTLGPGETVTYSVPVELGAPTHGRYIVFGSLFGPGEPVHFESTTSATPTLLLVVGALLVIDALVVLFRAYRRRYSPETEEPVVELTGEQPQVTSRQTPGEQMAIQPFSAFSGGDLTPRLEPVSSGVARGTAVSRPDAFFGSRRAFAACAATAALFVVVVFMATACSSDKDKAGTASGVPASEPDVVTSGPMPVRVTFANTKDLVDGSEVRIKVLADKDSQTFGFEAFLCSGVGTTFEADADVRPTLSGQCASKPLSTSSERYKEVAANPPFRDVESTFRVGIGTDSFVQRDGQSVTITCGPANLCKLVLKVQYPNGFGFVAQGLHYR